MVISPLQWDDNHSGYPKKQLCFFQTALFFGSESSKQRLRFACEKTRKLSKIQNEEKIMLVSPLQVDGRRIRSFAFISPCPTNSKIRYHI